MGSKSYSNISLSSLQDRNGIQNKRTRWDSPRAHDRSYASPLTLTPRSSPIVASSRSRLKRYSLADVGFMSPSYNERNRLSPLQNVYNSPNLSFTCTQIDSRSPGYAGRVVQYSQETEKSFPIVNSKYNKPGVFPIVHFFKKDLPSPQRKRPHVSAQMHSPELTKYNTPEQNRMLLETIIHSTPENKAINSHNNEVNTKSVLDALKEISRKRIHANEEEYIASDDGKGAYLDYVTGPNARKKVKLNMSQVENSHNNSNKYSTIDELKASFSSMEGQEIKKPKIEKKTEIPRPVVRVAVQVDVETQTPAESQAVEPTAETKIPEETENLDAQEKKTKKVSPVKIFDETPLETMRKNRLSALMGSLTETKAKENNQVSIDADTKQVESKVITSEKPLVSILSSPVKSPNKVQKHVTFSLPAPTTTSEVLQQPQASVPQQPQASVPQQPQTSVPQEIVNVTNLTNDHVTKTSVALITPIVSSIVSEGSSLKTAEMKIESSNGFMQPKTDANQFQSSFLPAMLPPSFSLTSTTTKPNVITSFPAKSQEIVNSVTTTASTSTPVLPAFNFGVPNTSSNIVKALSTTTTTTSGFDEPKIMPTFSFGNKTATTSPSKSGGGFKFDLQPAASSVATPTFAFVPPSQPNKTLFNVPNESKKTAATTAFPQVTSPVSTTFSLIPILSSAVVTTSDSKPFPFVSPNAFSASSNFSTFSKSTVSTTTQSSTSSTSTFMNKAPSFAFSSNSDTPFALGFNSFSSAPKTTTTTSVTPFFASVTQSVTSSETSTVFNKPITSFTSTPNPPPPFGVVFNSGTASNNNTNFGGFNNSNSTSSVFGGNNLQVPSFGGEVTAKPFVQATPSVAPFGATTTTANTVFGATFATPPSAFPSSPAPATATTTNSIFGNTPSGGFGTNTTAPIFGTTTATSTFGINTAPNFTANSFGVNQNFSTTSFGNAFGVATTTAATTSDFKPFTQATPNNVFASFGEKNSSFHAAPFGSSSFPPNPTVSQGEVFTFGQSATKPAVFSFGSNEAKPAFNFTAADGNGANFAANKGFGNAFGAGSTAPFNVQPVQTGMFNIGTGSSTPSRSRTQLKAKRRT